MSNEQPQGQNTKQQIEWHYEVLVTIKFRGVVIKPPAFIQLSEMEAAQLIAWGYIGAARGVVTQTAPDCATALQDAQSAEPVDARPAKPPKKK